MDVINEAILHAANAWWILPIVYLFCLIDGFFPVLPSETLLVALASVAVTTGTPNMLALALVGAAGAITGDQIAYRMGRRIGTERFRWMRLRRSRRIFAFAHHELMKRGAMLIFTARYIPVGRVAVNFTAGATRYPLARFSALDMVSCLVWAAYSVSVGAFAGQWFEANKVLGIVLSIVVAVVLGYLLDRIVYAVLRRLGKPTEAPEYELMRRQEEADGDAA